MFQNQRLAVSQPGDHLRVRERFGRENPLPDLHGIVMVDPHHVDERVILPTQDAEDRVLMDRFGEQGIFAQVGGLFQGKLAWLAAVTFIVATIMVAIGIYAAWKFATVDDMTAMVRWGGLAWAGLTVQMMIKLWSWMRMESNRVIREVKRLELQIARLQANTGG